MWRKIHWKHYLAYAIAAAIAYCIPVAVYIDSANYSSSWLLFLGNALFLLVITAFLFSFNKRRREDASTITMLTAGHITTVMGIAIACLLSAILLWVMVPGIFDSGMADKVMENSPANTVKDKTGGMSFRLFADAVIGNVTAGSFVSIIFPFVLKRNQTSEAVPRRQAEL